MKTGVLENPLALQAECEARQRASYAYEGNRHERRADEAIARRNAAKRAAAQPSAPVFYGRAITADIIGG